MSIRNSISSLVVVLAAFMLFSATSGCASPGDASVELSSFNDSLIRERLAVQEEREDALIDCAIFNGVDIEDGRAYLAYAVPIITNQGSGVPLTESEQRSEFAERGSGLVHGLREFEIQLEVRESTEAPPQVVLDVMRSGPVTDPVNQQRFDGGCDRWVDDTFVQSSGSTRLFALESSWGQYASDFLAGSSELADLDGAWSRCMAGLGYENMAKLGDQLGLIFPLATQVEAGELDFNEGLEADIQISLASFDCMSEVRYHGERERLLADAWQDFNS